VLTEWYWPEEETRAYLTSNSQTGHATEPSKVPFYSRGARARRLQNGASRPVWWCHRSSCGRIEQ
jgi:hypothetical protein